VKTKADFQQAIRDSLSGFPDVEALYRVSDPRILQHLDAMAAMLAMSSADVEVAAAEPYEKARDATVLADAALKGIVRKAVPTKARIAAVNSNATAYTIGAGVTVLDSSGRPWRVETPLALASGATGTLEALQLKSRTIAHTVSESEPFYQIEIPDAADGQILCGISVSDAAGNVFAFAEKFTNIGPGDKVYHVEVDEYQRTFIRFGWGGVVGYQPADGEVITVELLDCFGDVLPTAASPFAFEYLYTTQDSLVAMALDAVIAPGQNAPSIKILRDLTRYPSIYDKSAVYLGEFDLLIRSAYPGLKFLSVWNEAVEESVRGASADNINALFIACVSVAGTEAMLDEPNPASPVAPHFILSADQTGTQAEIKATVALADDSYKVRLVTPVRSKITITVAATVPSSYDAATVRQQIVAALLAEYGIDTLAAKRGALNPLYQKVYALLRAQVPALQNAESDIAVSISSPPNPMRPEHWRFVDEGSLDVTVALASVVVGAWGMVS